jgi:hypothetical protein
MALIKHIAKRNLVGVKSAKSNATVLGMDCRRVAVPSHPAWYPQLLQHGWEQRQPRRNEPTLFSRVPVGRGRCAPLGVASTSRLTADTRTLDSRGMRDSRTRSPWR